MSVRVDRPSPTPNAPAPITHRAPSGKLYPEPAAGEALKKGHGGDLVKQLQQALNAAGAKPPLTPDGLFGPATEAALQKLTGKTSIDPATLSQLKAQTPAAQSDGFDPTDSIDAKGQTISSQQQTVEVDNTRPPASGSVAERSIQIAQSENDLVNPMKRGDDGNYKGWQHLQTVFEKTTGWRPTDAEIKASSQPQGKSWCGIWACHVLQEAGVDVKWDLNKGGMVGNVDHVLQPRFQDYRTYKAERQAFENTIKPGDVITLKGANNHHAIVTKVNGDGTVECMDGNKPHIGPSHRKLEDVTSYYRPKE